MTTLPPLTAPRYDYRRLRDVMETQGRSQVWLFEWLADWGYETKKPYISMYLSGRMVMPDRFVEGAAQALGLPLSLLLNPEHERSNGHQDHDG